MRRIALPLLLILASMCLVLAPTTARAQDHGVESTPETLADPAHAVDTEHAEHEPVGAIPSIKQGLVTAIVSIVVFLIVLAVLGSTVWPKVVKGLNDRDQKIREEITAAEQARKQSKQALEQYEVALREAQAEARRMLEETKSQQQKLAADLRAKADIELASMKERARADIESAKKSALTEIYSEAANLATMVAAKILRRELGDADQQRLLDESLRELQSIES